MKRGPRGRHWAGAAALLALLLAAWLTGGLEGVLGEAARAPALRGRMAEPAEQRAGGRALARLFEARISGEVVEGSGRVRAVLPDDRQGSPHQRFLLELAGGRTVLVSHNVDLAARVEGLERGDTVEFRGQYEWNEKGGVLHWTHHDPAGRRPGGWLRHAGATYR